MGMMQPNEKARETESRKENDLSIKPCFSKIYDN